MDIGFFFVIVIWMAVIVAAFILLFLLRNRIRYLLQPSKNNRSLQHDTRHILEKTIPAVAGLFILSFGSVFITVMILINLDHGENPLLLNRVWVPAAFMLNTFALGLIGFVLGAATVSNRKVQPVRETYLPEKTGTELLKQTFALHPEGTGEAQTLDLLRLYSKLSIRDSNQTRVDQQEAEREMKSILGLWPA